MLIKRFLNMLWIIMVILFGVTACVPAAESEVNVVVPSSATEAALESEVSAMVPSSVTETTSTQVQGSGEGIIVDITPMTDTELANQPPGQSEPGAGAANNGSQVDPEEQVGQLQPGTTIVYSDSTYKFKVNYPTDFVFRTQPVEKLNQLNPIPAASFIFMDPITAASDLGDLEPADLEIRVYVVGPVMSLDAWLTSNGLLSADGSVPSQPFQTANVSGVEVCTSTMIAPGCSYFVLGGDWVYQLRPATLEGEAIADTLTLIP